MCSRLALLAMTLALTLRAILCHSTHHGLHPTCLHRMGPGSRAILLHKLDVVDDEDGFAATRGASGVVSEARGVGGGVVDVEGTREVEGVIKK
jgi:hypothetical protein